MPLLNCVHYNKTYTTIIELSSSFVTCHHISCVLVSHVVNPLPGFVGIMPPDEFTNSFTGYFHI